MFFIKQNDTLPLLKAQLLDFNNEPVDLTLCAVYFHMNTRNGVSVINRQIEITDYEEGRVVVTWEDGDTSVSGVYNCEFQVILPDGNILTVPNTGYFIVSIVPELS